MIVLWYIFYNIYKELLIHPNPKKTLYVVPEKYSNIARFVCGIDNKIKEVKIIK